MSQVITQSDSPLIYSVVLNWNQPEDTLACLDSLARQEEIRQKLLIVDNASTDDSVQRIQACFPQAEILVNPSNLGFGRGFNCGVGHAFRVGADYVFIANNDTFLEPHTISTLLRHMTRDVGLLAPAIYYASHPEVIWSMGGKTNRWNLEVIEDVRANPIPETGLTCWSGISSLVVVYSSPGRPSKGWGFSTTASKCTTKTQICRIAYAASGCASWLSQEQKCGTRSP